MILPDFLVGPQFADGDIVEFAFEDAELTLRLPVIPNYQDRRDIVSSIKNFNGIDTANWRQFGDDGQCGKEIVHQRWIYYDDVTHDDIAGCSIDLEVRKHSKADESSCFSLNSSTFRSHYLKSLADHFSEPPETRPDWPSVENNFFAKPIAKLWIDGLQFQLDLGGGKKYPVLVANLSLGRKYTLNINFRFGSLHYSDRKNPYSDELLHKLSFDLFDEFLSFIRIDYSPEVIELIKNFKTEGK